MIVWNCISSFSHTFDSICIQKIIADFYALRTNRWDAVNPHAISDTVHTPNANTHCTFIRYFHCWAKAMRIISRLFVWLYKYMYIYMQVLWKSIEIKYLYWWSAMRFIHSFINSFIHSFIYLTLYLISSVHFSNSFSVLFQSVKG